MASKDDLLAEELEAFQTAVDAESENREVALEDLEFARLGEQWPEKIRKQREEEGRPVLTINKMPAFIRQVVNDSRQNRPQIKVKPVDDNADKDTANVLEGLVRNIERTSKADVAYDTAVDYACSMGFGYIRVSVDYEYDDSFDKCIKIERVANPFSVYGDPHSTSVDGSDWNRCWITELIEEGEFERKYKGAEKVDWQDSGYMDLNVPWREGKEILVAEAWHREITERDILKLSNGNIVGAKEYEAGRDLFEMMGITPVTSRKAKAYKITQRIMTGAEILEENEWQGQYLPIVPVYGEEINVEGKRYFRSLINQAKDAQRMFNYWRTNATELVALAPRVPFIGEEGTFDVDPNWLTANTASHAFLMHKRGSPMPQRQPLGTEQAIGSMSQALAAGDDMKAIIGMYDASLGQRSNETSGRAIMARQKEGDVNTFHFIDNLARSIRQVGCVLVDLIPKVYSGERIMRIIGPDQTEQTVKVGQPPEGQQMPTQGQQQPMQGQQQPGKQDPNGPMPDGAERIYDLSVGRYDVAVDTGPSFTTKREESALQMTEFVRAYPQAAPIIGDLLVKALDWPQADEIAERLKSMIPQQAQGGIPPELQQMIEQGKQMIGQLQQENQQLKTDKQLEAQKIKTDSFKAETDRLKELLPYMPPEALAAMGLQMNVQAMNTPDIAPGQQPMQPQGMPQ